MAWRSTLLAAAVLLAAIVASGCAVLSVPVQPPLGLLFGRQRAPLTTDFRATRVGSKHGQARTRWLRDPYFTRMPLFAWGDASIEQAARQGEITQLDYADYEVLSVLGIYMEFTVHVYGE